MSPATDRKPDANKELMLAMGSRDGRYDPMPPEQYRWLINHKESAVVSMLAWLWSQTIALNHRKPYAVDEHGRPIYIKQVAGAMEWEETTTYKYLARAAREGLIRVDKKARRIYLQARLVPQEGLEFLEPEGRTESEEVLAYREKFGSQNIDSIMSRPLAEREAALRRLRGFRAFERKVHSDTMAAMRAGLRKHEDILYQDLGMSKDRLETRREEPKLVVLTIVGEPEELPAEEVCTGESTAPAEAPYEDRNKPVPASASFIVRDTNTNTSSSSVSSKPAEGKEEEEKPADPPPMTAMEFHHRLQDLFVAVGKPSPTFPSSKRAFAALSQRPDLPEKWLDHIPGKTMAGWKTAGVIEQDARRFAADDQLRRQQLQNAERDRATRAAEEKRRTDEELREMRAMDPEKVREQYREETNPSFREWMEQTWPALKTHTKGASG